MFSFLGKVFFTKTPSFQQRVKPWLVECFGENFGDDDQERDARAMEEMLELFQARGRSFDEVITLAIYVFSRPKGEVEQELGGVMTTLAAMCLANGLDMHEAGEKELARIWTKVEAIRQKQLSKPKNTVLPGAAQPMNNWQPTDAQCRSACYSFRHDFGLLSEEEQRRTVFEAKEWLRAWMYELPKTPALRHVPSPPQIPASGD